MDIKLTKSTLIIEGFIFAILGVLAIALPTATTYSITIIIGVLCVIAGIIQLVRIYQNRGNSSFFPAFIGAILAIVIGVLLLYFPTHGAAALTLLLGVYFFFHGIIQFGMSLQVRKSAGSWGILMFSGLVSIVLALIIWSGWPSTAMWVIGLLLGINLLMYGISLLAIGLSIRTEPSQ